MERINRQSVNTKPALWYAIGATVLFVGLLVISQYNFLLVHSFAEFFSITIAWSFFLIVWNTRKHSENGPLIFLGIAYLYVGLFDFIHTLAYKGMGVFDPSWGANLPTQLWIIARFMESIALLIFSCHVRGRSHPLRDLGLWGGVSAVLLIAVFGFDAFPDSFVEGEGLTPFKIVSEYLICLILLLAAWMLYRNRDQLDRVVFRLIWLSIVLTIVAELAFTFYLGVYDLSNLVGHYFKIISFILIYLALIREGLSRPMSVLFRSLHESEFRQHHFMHTTSSGVWWAQLSPAVPIASSAEDQARWIVERALISDCNHRFVEFVGKDDRESLLGQKLVDLLSANREEAEALISQFVRYSFELTAAEICHRQNDGSEHTYLVSMSSHLSQDGLDSILGNMVDITRQKKQQRIDEATLRLKNYSVSHSVHELLRHFLDEAEALTDSKIGFFHFVRPDQEEIHLQTWSTKTMETFCEVGDSQGQHYPISRAGVWVDCVAQKKPVIHNDYQSLTHKKGLPDGHAPIYRELVVPVIRNDTIVAILGVGNKETPYVDEDVQTVQRFADAAWETVERRRAEEELQRTLDGLEAEVDYRTRQLNETVHELETIFNTSRVGMIVLKGDRRIQKANPRAADLLGYASPKEMEQLPIATHHLSKESYREFGEKYYTPLREGEVMQIDYPLRKTDGTTIWCSLSGKALDSANPPDISKGSLWVLDDISERIGAEHRMRDLAQKLKDAHQLSRSGWWEYDVVQDKVIWPKETYAVYGLDPDKDVLNYERLVNMIVPEFRDYHNQMLERLYQSGEGDFTYPIQHPKGEERWIWARGEAVYNEEKQPIRLFGTLQDITDQKRGEEVLLQAKQQAESASLAKTAFLSNMSHELRTPLNAILGYTQLLQVDDTLNSKQLSGIQTIHQAGEHLLQIINDILDMSKIEAGKLDLVENKLQLQDFFANILEFMAGRAKEKGIALRYEPAEPLPVLIEADELRLRQVLMNLLSNAIKFTAHGSTCLKVSAEPLADGRHRLMIRVEDTGVGIPRKYQQDIFKPFQQVSDRLSSLEGTGLGLSISRKLVERMGGQLTVESPLQNPTRDREGPGSGFTFSIEVTALDQATAQQVETLRVTGYRWSTGRITPARVLIVDDHLSNRTVLRDSLEPLGFEIEEADDGSTVLMRSLSFKPDIILMDLRMETCDGFSALSQLKQQATVRDIPVLAVTAASTTEVSLQKRCREHGFRGLIQKPFVLSELLEAMESCLPIRLDIEKDRLETLDLHPAVERPPAEWREQLLVLLQDGDLERVLQAADDFVPVENGRYTAYFNMVKELAGQFKLSELEAYLQSNE